MKFSPKDTPLPNDLCALTRADKALKVWQNTTLSLGGYGWNLFPEEAEETYISPSNNDCGTVRSPFVLENLENVVIDGEGARLLVRGTPQAGRGRTGIIDAPVVPFVIRNCRNVTLRKLSIDWATPGTVQGRVTAVDPEGGSFDVAVDTDQRIWCWNQQMYLEGEGWTWPVRRLLGGDPETGAMTPGTGDNLGAGYDVTWTFESLDEKTVRIRGPKNIMVEVGQMIFFWCSNHDTGARRAPAVFVEDSVGVTFEEVTLNYCWAMGVIAQNSEDLVFKQLVVEPSGMRKFSLAADGTHFVSCRGRLEFVGCRIQNQFDDAINTHGLYHQAVRRISPTVLRIRSMHPQHQGVNTYQPGDRLRLCKGPYMLEMAENSVAGVSRINSEFQDLEMKDPLPENFDQGDYVENLSAYPEILIRDCVFRWNRARGILLNGNRKIRVENCDFENPGCGIQFESSPAWAESGPVTDVRIEGNRFLRCGTCGLWGSAVIEAVPAFRQGKEVPADLPPFNGRFLLRNNQYSDCPGSRHHLESYQELLDEDGPGME